MTFLTKCLKYWKQTDFKDGRNTDSIDTTIVHMFVLGIDPGLSRCGYGLVRQEGRRFSAKAAGVIRTEATTPLADRLSQLQIEIRSLIEEHRPDEVAVERVLFSANTRTAMQTGHASGVAMAEAASSGCPVTLYSPTEVKSAVAGWGGADKGQIERMVQTLLGIEIPLKPVDAADAVAVALCHLAVIPSLGLSAKVQ